ncbi:hypothetical protein [Plebeiibacterium sediminum]|uniref:ADP,ATP carrier protein n=1 Tax=Plebeiibacterium sediminum TaxID=2992112 RepID=A0AAE3SGK4_9BACT|nr:hypothetical protein [Plebeiobacterium sediminum]MCW3788192.1 hypothetical protein [Plebeiobacterium sediminum]
MEIKYEGRKYLNYLLNAFFDVKPGEVKKVFLMQLNIFLTVTTLLIIKPVANALFLAQIGVDKLPYSFVLVAATALLLSRFYSKKLINRSLSNVIKVTLLVSAFALIVFSVLLQLNLLESWVLYLFYIGVAIFGLLTTSQFWILSNLVFNTREAKRLFGIVGAGAIAGGIFGGYLTTVLAPLVSVENMLFVAAFILFVNVKLNRMIWVRYVNQLNTYQHQKRVVQESKHPIQLIRQSKHLTYLALIIGLGVIVSKLVDFQFSALASRSIYDPDELAAFFGLWFSNFNVISLLIQLLITRRVVGIYGVGSSLFVLPAFILFSTSLLFIFPILAVAILLKTCDVSIKQSINKAATELLALPIPSGIKSQTKSFIDVFVDTAATGISGLLLIFVVNGMNLSTTAVNILIVMVVLVWFYIARKVRIEYISAFKQKLIRQDGKNGKSSIDFSNESVIQGLKKVLEKGTEKQKLFILKKIEQLKDIRFATQVLPLLESENIQIRIEALRCMYFMPMIFDESLLIKYLQDKNIEVRQLTFDILLRYSTEGRVRFIQRFLQNEDPLVSSAALVGLSIEARDNAEMKRVFQLNSLIRDKIDYLKIIVDQEELIAYKSMILRSIGHANVEEFYPFINQSIEIKTDKTIVNEAIKAAGFTLNATFVPVLVSLLCKDEYKDTACQSLAHFGPAIFKDLLIYYEDPSVNSEIKQSIPKVAEYISSPASVDFLLMLIKKEDSLFCINVLNSLNQLRINSPHLLVNKKTVIRMITEEASLFQDILSVLYTQQKMILSDADHELNKKKIELKSELIRQLEFKMDQILESIFKLLGLRYPPEEIGTVYENIQSKSQEQRYAAIEFIENILDNDLKKILIPIIEIAALDKLTDEVVKSMQLKKLNEIECFDLLLNYGDKDIIQSVSAIVNISLKEEALESLIKKYSLF